MTIDQIDQPTAAAHTAALWGHQPLRFRDRLHERSAFSRSRIAKLIGRHPRSRCTLIDMGKVKERRFQRAGEIGDLSGDAVIDAIERGRLRLTLRHLDEVDGACFKLAEHLVQEIIRRVPDFSPIQFSCDLSVSSPGVQIGYRSDPRRQLMWQLGGRRRVDVWPPTAPFVTAEHLEDTALSDSATVVPHAPWYDAHARTVELEPGEMLTWPLCAPHRIQNLDGLNVSMTVSFSDHASRRLRHVNVANGLLRHRFGYTAKSRSIRGPAYWSKAVFQRALKGSAPRRGERGTGPCPDSHPDAANPSAIIERAAAE